MENKPHEKNKGLVKRLTKEDIQVILKLVETKNLKTIVDYINEHGLPDFGIILKRELENREGRKMAK